MENKRNGIWASIIDAIKAFASIEDDNTGKIDENKLTAEEKKELAEIRKIDKVEALEEKTSLRKKYGATVDEAEANKNMKKTEKEKSEKTIGRK